MTESAETVVVTNEIPAAPARSPLPAPALLALVAALCVASFAVPVALVARSGAVAETPVVSDLGASQASRTAPPATTPLRVVTATATSERLSSGQYGVTFVWVLEGARLGDVAAIRFFVGSTLVGDDTGNLDSNIFNPSTGQLRLTTEQNCSVEGWSAELVSIRSQAPQGERIARAAGVACG